LGKLYLRDCKRGGPDLKVKGKWDPLRKKISVKKKKPIKKGGERFLAVEKIETSQLMAKRCPNARPSPRRNADYPQRREKRVKMGCLFQGKSQEKKTKIEKIGAAGTI